MRKKPKILSTTIAAKTQVFCVESMQLEFSNGVRRTYERLKAGKNGAVMIVPIDSKGNLILIREYAAGTEKYELAFPKGLIEPDETALQAANRELKEEVGFGAKQLTYLKPITLAPGYLSHTMYMVLAEDLYAEKLEGDEPEEIEICYWPLNDKQRLLQQPDFTEARSIAALYMADDFLKQRTQ